MNTIIQELDQMLADVDFFTSVIGRLFIPGIRAEIVELKEEIEREDL